MPASIGVNLRVTGHCRQGGRKYMEDFFSVAYQQTEDERDLEYAFFGIYDGHGGAEAAAFAKERLMETIVRHKNFWSDNDEDVLRAIKLGYIDTHYAMWKEQEKWPKTASGLPSTAGTTASIAFIRRGKIYIGHVGDSGIVLGYQEPGSNDWKAKPLTRDHKPECAMEMSRIEQSGGKVIAKSGVPRVVWNRPRIGHKGPVRRSTPIDEIPFLAVARSLGDLWSYNSELDEFVVSPDPDCSVFPIDTSTFRCLIFGTDGLYNMLNPQMAVHIVQQAEKHNEEATLSDSPNKVWLNPSKCLVERALELWSTTKMRADNTSVVTLMLDPPGPPRAQVLRNRKKNYSDSGLQIVTRYQNEPTSSQQQQQQQQKEQQKKDAEQPVEAYVLKPRESLSHDPKENSLQYTTVLPPSPPPNACFGDVSKDTDLKTLSFKSVQSTTQVCRGFQVMTRNQNTTNLSVDKKDDEVTTELRSFNCRNSDFESFASTSYQNCISNSADFDDEKNASNPTSSDEKPNRLCETCSCNNNNNKVPESKQKYEEKNIQIHEISSSSNEMDDVCEAETSKKSKKQQIKQKFVADNLRRLRKRPPEHAQRVGDSKHRKADVSTTTCLRKSTVNQRLKVEEKEKSKAGRLRNKVKQKLTLRKNERSKKQAKEKKTDVANVKKKSQGKENRKSKRLLKPAPDSTTLPPNDRRVTASKSVRMFRFGYLRKLRRRVAAGRKGKGK